jgi:hypothetical protein
LQALQDTTNRMVGEISAVKQSSQIQMMNYGNGGYNENAADAQTFVIEDEDIDVEGNNRDKEVTNKEQQIQRKRTIEKA